MPQIVLNVHRGTARQSLTTEFIVGTTFARLVLPVYFYGYSDNVLDVEVSRECSTLAFTRTELGLTFGPASDSVDLYSHPVLVATSLCARPPVETFVRRSVLPLAASSRLH